MKEAQKNQRIPVNRCFGGQQHQNPEQQRTEKIKEVLTDAAQRRKANKEIDSLREQFHHRKSILELLPVIKLRCSPSVLAVALERVERRRNVFTMDDLVFFETFKASLKQEE